MVDNTEIPAHKVVLSSCSQYFYAMFTGDLAEAKSDRITLQEIDPKALIQLIDFVYTSEIHVTEENVQVNCKAIKSASNYFHVKVCKMKVGECDKWGIFSSINLLLLKGF